LDDREDNLIVGFVEIQVPLDIVDETENYEPKCLNQMTGEAVK